MLTCAAAGVRFGYDLAWVLVFATAAVFVLQSFTAGTGILAGLGPWHLQQGNMDTAVVYVSQSLAGRLPALDGPRGSRASALAAEARRSGLLPPLITTSTPAAVSP